MKKSFGFILAVMATLTLSACTFDFNSCNTGEAKCNGEILMGCSIDNEWTKTLDCQKTDTYCDKVRGCVDCRSSDDCKDPLKPICNEQTNACQRVDAVCGRGETRCEGNTFQTCNVDQSGFDDKVCGGTTPFCDATKGCIECRDTNDCTDPAKLICDEEAKSCQSKEAVCTKGQMKCDGNAFLRCNIAQSGFDKTVCSGTTPHCNTTKGCVGCNNQEDCSGVTPICNTVKNVCEAGCRLGDSKCEEGMLATCLNTGYWKYSACDKGCDTEGKACAVCNESDAVICANASTLKRCNDKKTGFENISCIAPTAQCHSDAKSNARCVECKSNLHCKDPNKPVCNETTNVCQVCIQEQTKCDDKVFQTCNAAGDGFDVTKDCKDEPTKQYCDDTKGCVRCLENQTMCDADKLYTCSEDNHWPTVGIACEGDAKACNEIGTACI